MSEITGSFYGMLLQDAVNIGSPLLASSLSASLMYKLGRNKAQKMLADFPALQRDARGMLEPVIAAIFTASPEFSFQVTGYSAGEVSYQLSGEDRYHRAAQQLGIAHALNWPVITPFLQGICDTLAPGWECAVTAATVDQRSQCAYHFRIRYVGEPQQPAVQLGMTPPFFRLPDAPLTTTGRLLSVDLGPARNFEGSNFTDLVQLCLSCEGWNSNRLYPADTNQYMLGQRFRAMRTGSSAPDSHLRAVVESLVVKKRKRKTIIRIFDEPGEMIYLLLFDYYQWNEDEFQRKFAHLQQEAPDAALPAQLPSLDRVDFHDPCNYTSLLSGITAAHCLGHFDGYPCVPALLLFRVLMLEADKWLRQQEIKDAAVHIALDTMAILPNRIMQPDQPYLVHTRVYKASAGLYKFVHDITGVEDITTKFSTLEFELEVLPA
jgi:hypothetical protein